MTVYQARRMVNASQSFVIILIRPVECESKVSTLTLAFREHESKLDNLIVKYSSPFDDILGFPPRRAMEHEIQFVTDSTLPNIGMYRNLALENDEIKQ